ncbi:MULTISPECIES: hypothetical protein [Haladaptatus]|uniref:hypothetical protein n=1 Tax=Haladaptatus TaxID=367188 RepID=UPI00111225D0|nr:hypothetical protein [Haladaptatus paucihalophilus]
MSSSTPRKSEQRFPTISATDPVGDLVYAVFDISIPALPVLVLILNLEPISAIGVKNALVFGWGTAVVGIALFYGEWVTPPTRTEPGWLSLTPSLFGVRILYYNVLLLVAGYCGGYIGSFSHSMYLSALVGITISTIAISFFPWVVDHYWSSSSK